jgi:Fe-S cluster assembly protein SufB
VHVAKNAENANVATSCDALLLDDNAKTNTYPYVDVQRNDTLMSHEARVGKVNEEDVFYLMSRGISETDALAMIVLGFLNDLTKVLPMEYSLELKRLIKVDMTGAVG